MKNIICFHNPDEENGWLSNWYLSLFQINDISFSSMEQYMMYKKAIAFQDSEIAEQILHEHDPAIIKELGRKVRGYDDIIWNGIRQIIIYQGLYAKFTQNKELKEKLIQTGDALLAECAVHDKIWGIGLSMQDEQRFDMKQWKGKNLLGFATMLVREQL